MTFLSRLTSQLFRLLFLLSLSIGLITLITSVLEIGAPFGGFLAAWRPPDKWMVDNGTPPWWEGLSQAGLTYRDQLLTLDGAPFDNNYPDVFRRAIARHQASLPLTVLRDGAHVTLNASVIAYRLGHLFEVKFAELISGMAVLLIGYLIYRVRPYAALNRAASLACAIFSINQWMWHLTLLGSRAPGLWVLDWIWLLVTPLLGPALLSFALHFLRQDTPLPRAQIWLIHILYALGLLLAFAHTITRQFVLPIDYAQLQTLRDVLYRIVVIDIFGGALAFLVILLVGLSVRSHARGAITSRTRQQRAMLALGFLIALPALARHLFVLLTDAGSFYVLGGLDMRYLYLGIPLTLSLAIVRYQTFKSELPLLLAISALVGSAILGSVGDWIVRRFLAPYGQQFNLPPFLIIFGMLFGAFLVFQLFSRRSMPRIFRWQSTSYNAVKRFGARLAGQTDLAQLPQQIVQVLMDELHLERAALRLQATTDDRRLTIDDQQTQTTRPPNLTPVRLANDPDGYDAAVWLGTSVAARPIGLLLLGKRRDEEIFHEQDFEIIELIAQQAALFLATAQQLHELRQVPQRVAEAQESERFRIAQELHDTVQQFLGRLPFQLEITRDLLTINLVAADKQLQQSQEEVQQAARTVREIRADLAPSQLQSGFVKPVQDVLARLITRTGIQVEATLPAELDSVLSMPARHALFRVFQQTLDNIEAHAQATHVTVQAACESTRVTFAIQDDGCGFDLAQPNPVEADDDPHAHFGLRSMYARLSTLGGALTIASQPGAGTRVEGWLPR